jgi:hypothetical protein
MSALPPNVLQNSLPHCDSAIIESDWTVAPACLSGLSDTEWNVLRDRARTTLHPEQAQMQQQLAKSLDDLRGGIEAARRMVRERCQMGEDEASNHKALADAKSAAA